MKLQVRLLSRFVFSMTITSAFFFSNLLSLIQIIGDLTSSLCSMWASRSDMKSLTTDQIKKYLETAAKGSKKDKALVTAYKVALDPPALEEFANGSEDEASDAEADKEGQEDEEMKDDEDKKSKKAVKKRKSGDNETGAEGAKKKRKASAAKENGSADNSEKKPRAKKEAGKKKEAAAAAASAAAVKETREEQTKHVLFLRHKLQKVFMTKDKPPQEEDMESMDKLFGKLENFQGLDLTMIRVR